MRYRELLREGTRLLEEAGIEEASADAWLLFSYAEGADRNWYYLHMEEEAGSGHAKRYLTLISRRCTRMPVQYITEEQEFMGLKFHVNESVLIPRLDTEVLVEECRKRLVPGASVLDLCTGSGCILVSLLFYGPKGSAKTETGYFPDAGTEPKDPGIKGTGADISGEALEVARQNARDHHVEASFIRGDLFENIEGTYDMIVSNPPYIASGEIDTLMPEVCRYEPRLALDGTKDGLFFYREIIREAKNYLKKGGWICFEIGCDQGEAVSRMMEAQGYGAVQVVRDLAGLDRVVVGKMQEG